MKRPSVGGFDMGSHKHNLVALLPMKANSERIPGKNFKIFNGKPLYRWILDTLLSLEQIESIVINTDAREILESDGLSNESRVQIRDRKPEICGDRVSMNIVLEDDVNSIDSEHYIMSHTTNPLLSSNTLADALDSYFGVGLGSSHDSLFSVTRHQTRFYSAAGKAINHDPSNLVPTQELDPWYEENSNFYIFNKNGFQETRSRIGLKPILYECSRIESVDIDEIDDWHIAQAAAGYLLK